MKLLSEIPNSIMGRGRPMKSVIFTGMRKGPQRCKPLNFSVPLIPMKEYGWSRIMALLNLYPGALSPDHLTPGTNEQEAVWTSGSLWTFWRRKMSLAPTGTRKPKLPARSIVPTGYFQSPDGKYFCTDNSKVFWKKWHVTILYQAYINPLALEMDIEIVAHHLCKMWIFYERKR